MSWYPADQTVPEARRTARLALRPLLAADVAEDYDAVMSSAPMLRAWSQSDWPADDFTLADNLEDLRRHEREHRERVAFTYTVREPGGVRCLGCVYLQPLRDEEAAWRGGAKCSTRVTFWVRTSEIAGDLDLHLLEVLREWLRESWTFERVVFSASPGDGRQLRLYREAGLEPLGVVTLADGRRISGHLSS
jgi:hypothetical protein